MDIFLNEILLQRYSTPHFFSTDKNKDILNKRTTSKTTQTKHKMLLFIKNEVQNQTAHYNIFLLTSLLLLKCTKIKLHIFEIKQNVKLKSILQLDENKFQN